MGLVFEAEDTPLNRTVALKVLRRETAREPTARQRFLREARAMASIHSDHVVTIYQVGEEAGLPYLAMELLEGESLESRLRRPPRLAFPEVLRLGQEIALGLQAAHARGLIHRDVKPANIWLEAPTGRVKLLDFGLARPTEGDTAVTRFGLVVGTPAYMSPEQAEADNVDARSDLFSLGCVLYQLATGQTPFPGASPMSVLKAILVTQPRPPRELDPSVPAGLSALILRLLEKDPALRPASAAEVVEALAALAAGRTESVPQRPAAPAPVSARPRRLARTAGVLAVLLAAAGVAGVLRWRSHGAAARPGVPSQPVVFARGVTADEILLGMSGPFSGQARELGRGVKVGIDTALQSCNDEGGVRGRRLRLVALDDGYEPERALQRTRELVEEQQVFALIGNVGTPTTERVLPYLQSKQVLLFGPYTGADFLRRQPPDPYVFNYRASYTEETEAIVKYLVQLRKLGPAEIAVFAQRDSFGDSGVKGVARAMRGLGRDPDPMLCVRFARNSVDVGEAVRQVQGRPAVKAVVMIAPYRPAARFIQKMRDAHFPGIFANVSFVNSEALGQELVLAGPGYADGVIVTQVVPPIDSPATAVARYRERLKRYHPDEPTSFASLEGYIAALVLIEGLRKAGDPPTPDALASALESIHGLDLGIGTLIDFGPSKHQGSHQVWGTSLDAQGRAHLLELQ